MKKTIFLSTFFILFWWGLKSINLYMKNTNFMRILQHAYKLSSPIVFWIRCYSVLEKLFYVLNTFLEDCYTWILFIQSYILFSCFQFTGSLSGGQVAGIVIGFIMGLLVVGMSVYFFIRRPQIVVMSRMFSLFRVNQVCTFLSILLCHRPYHVISLNLLLLWLIHNGIVTL